MCQAIQHRKDGDYDAAMAVLKQVSIIDPRYQPARWMLEDLDEVAALRKQRAINEEFRTQMQGALTAVDEAKIPWHVELMYPDNWPEITARRVPLGGRLPGSRIFAALDKPIHVDFAGEPLDTVLAQLSKQHDLNIVPNWNDLKHSGIDRKTPIELYLPSEISLRRALTEVMEQASAGVAEIGFDVRDDVLKVATRKTLDQEAYTVVYDINDLLMEIPHFADGPLRDLHDSNSEIAVPQLSNGTPPWSEVGDAEEDFLDPQRSGRLQQIIDLIQSTVAPSSWRDRGGTVGTIAEINGQLVVTQNSASQTAIGDLLGKLREQRAIQIAVEARFVTVSSNYLEELGMDIDVVLNSGNAGYDYVPSATGPTVDPVTGQPVLLPRTFSRLGFTPNAPVGVGTPTATTPNPVPQPYGQPVLVPQASGGAGSSQSTPVPVKNSILSWVDPANLASDIPGSFAGGNLPPAFSLFGSFLDNIQVDFLIRATQADSRTTVLTAPQLVLFNGQRSWVAVTIQQNFVSTLNPVVAQGAVAQAPVIGTINSGAVLDVEATVTADRRYVTMTLRPAVTRLLDMQTFAFSGGAAGGGFGGGTALNAFVQLPLLSTQTVRTTVSVPDGGTLLIGGQKLASEQEVEAGVPVLSKIPLLRRAYSSRTKVKDEQILLMLIKPKILIQTEQEELAFPGFAAP
jgi:general secretion pathway protein D